MAASRTLFAVVIFLTLAIIFRDRLRLIAPDLKILFLSGLLLWIGGNGLMVWAERHAHSGFPALIIGTTPMWPTA
jgi:drug/metabolite transporter (DMT)-like permease